MLWKKLTDSWQRLKQFCELPGNCTNWNVFMQLDGNTNPFEFQRALKQLVASQLLKDWTVHHQEPQKSATKRENTGEPTVGNLTLFFFGTQSVFTLIWMYLRSIIPSNKVLVWKKKIIKKSPSFGCTPTWDTLVSHHWHAVPWRIIITSSGLVDPLVWMTNVTAFIMYSLWPTHRHISYNMCKIRFFISIKSWCKCSSTIWSLKMLQCFWRNIFIYLYW